MSQTNYLTADLHITQTGETTGIHDSKELTIRLSPVNKRVLLTLLAQADQTVSRQQLFDAVWPNQVISDDALTRCISDLRAQLKTGSYSEPLIQTVPKIGYRWLPKVKLTSQTAEQIKGPIQWQVHLKSIVLALIMLWAVAGAVYWLTQSSVVPLVILPTEQTQNQPNTIATDVADVLKKQTLAHSELQFLSQYAIESHQGSPFPYFSHEFGVRWFIGSHMSLNDDQSRLSLNLIDAKTALVIYSITEPINDSSEIHQHCQTFIEFVADL